MRCSKGVEVIDVSFSENFLTWFCNKFEFIESLEVTFIKTSLYGCLGVFKKCFLADILQ